AATAHMRGTAATHYSRRVAAGLVLGEACGRHSHRQDQGDCSDGTQNSWTDHGRLHQGDTAQLFGQADVPERAQIVRGMEPRLSNPSCTRNERIARSPRQIATEKRPPRRFTDGSLIAGLNWTICRADGIRVAAFLEPARP
ncbi:MAG TPA: hypothetical protein VN831_18275, partial [Bradyrhizobium sp.]|nr:hypothetical protein [Bradyrhizobium sp.]